MTTLSAARTRGYTNTQTNGLPISTSTTIWGGAAVGIHPTTGAVGLAGPGMLFCGFAKSSVNHIRGQQRDTVVTVVDCGQVVLAVSGAVQADVGKDVYATDDDTFTFSSSAGSFVGVAKQLVSSGKLLVEIAPPSMLNAVRLAPGGTFLVSGDGSSFLYGPVTSGTWMKVPSLFRLRITGTGTLQMDSKDSLGNITEATFPLTTYTSETDKIEFPYAGDDAVTIRVTFTGTLTCEVI